MFAVTLVALLLIGCGGGGGGGSSVKGSPFVGSYRALFTSSRAVNSRAVSSSFDSVLLVTVASTGAANIYISGASGLLYTGTATVDGQGNLINGTATDIATGLVILTITGNVNPPLFTVSGGGLSAPSISGTKLATGGVCSVPGTYAVTWSTGSGTFTVTPDGHLQADGTDTAGTFSISTGTVDPLTNAVLVSGQLTGLATTVNIAGSLYLVPSGGAAGSGTIQIGGSTVNWTATISSGVVAPLVVAEAGLFTGTSPDQANGTPGIKITWDLGFLLGNSTGVQYQVFRMITPPVGVAAVNFGTNTTVDSTAAAPGGTIYDFGGIVGGTACTFSSLPSGTAVSAGGLNLGQSMQYGVEEVYKFNALDLPNPPPGAQFCYFVSQRAITGLATPLAKPASVSPADATVISAPVTFTFQSSEGALPLQLHYALELSGAASFDSGSTVIAAESTSSSTGELSFGPVDLSSSSLPSTITSAATVYWRVGVRSDIDQPGPLPDSSGFRYVFGDARSLVRT